ncbi:uncharacterized protein LOC136091522 [Hydra vulgaris]|uniref:Uncharacterized protein LOC136091522 n=1 Tax=Hydra vulgaris TaxID=6087 RepID=A0ABM4DL35_HYDVU
MNKIKRTRSNSCPGSIKVKEFIGLGADLLPSELPTLRNVLQLLLLEMESLDTNLQYVSKEIIHEAAKKSSCKVVVQYQKVNINIQIQPNHYIVQRIEKEWKRVTQTVWGRVTNTRKDKLYNEMDTLFDILRCKHSIKCKEDPTCSDPKCSHCAFLPICNCPLSLKIPEIELKFIRAQRLKVGMKSVFQIHCRDKKEHTRLAKQCNRKEKPLMFKKLEEQKVELSNNKFFNEEIEVDVIENANESSSQLMDTKIDDGSKQSVINTNHFPLLAQTVF